MDVYTEFGVRASKFKNPVNDVGVTKLYGIDDIAAILEGLNISRVELQTTFVAWQGDGVVSVVVGNSAQTGAHNGYCSTDPGN